jgi:hypothetical protein
LQLYLLLLGFRRLTVPARGGDRPLRSGLTAGVILALATVIKLTAALPAVLLLVERIATARRTRSESERRLACGYGGGLVVGLVAWLLIVPAGLIGWQRNLDCLERWCTLVPTKAIDTGADQFAGDSYSVRNQSLTNAVRHLGAAIAGSFSDSLNDGPSDSSAATAALLAARLAILAVVALAAVRAGRSGNPLVSLCAFGLALMATLAVSPVARTHYFLLIAPAVLAMPWFLHVTGRRRLAWWLAWTPTALVMPQYFWPLATGRVGWLGLGVTAWLIVGASLLLKDRHQTILPPRVLAWRERAAERFGRLTDRFARRRRPVSCAVGGSDPSEN